ncbi:hypothetical protein ACIQ6K_24750 [Streptomyces sp. NPDC096354]|uniref:hypothetical protein n=1 Tax=Streptomyces sp. NPDC096354 TaxID=3366088 RepID=UPI00380E3C66
MTAPASRSGQLVRSPVVLRDGQWWLVSGAGSILATDPMFTDLLDDFTQKMAAADQAVADLRTRQSEPPASDAEGER